MAAAVSDRLGALQELAEQSPRQDRMTPESMTPESMTPESMTPESTIIALWITWLVSWGVAAFWSNRTEKTGGTIAEIGFRILMWAGAILLLVPFSDRLDYARVPFWHLNAALKWILAALTAIGLLFVWWARIHLGRLWSAVIAKKAGHHVVDTGPYRFVRHPIYSGLIFAAFATAIEKRTLIALFGAAILTFAFYIKARREERFLRLEIGEAGYDAYARKTAMLVPFTGRPPN